MLIEKDTNGVFQQTPLVYAITNWPNAGPKPDIVKTHFEVWQPEREWTKVDPPPGWRSTIPQSLSPSGWVGVRLTNAPLTQGIGTALSGSIPSHRSTEPVEGALRFWRDGQWRGTQPPDLPLRAREEMRQWHWVLTKFDPLELYSTRVEPLNPDSKGPCSNRIRWRLDGRWRTFRQLVPSWKGDEQDLEFIADYGGYLFVQDNKKKEFLILNIPEAWR